VSGVPALLALDAAFGPAAGCLMLPDGRVFTAETDQEAPHSQSILPMLHDLLAQAGIDWGQLGMCAVGTGPGSFTGLRVAAAIIAGINAGLGLPVLSLSSLAITSAQVRGGDEIHVLEDARAGFVYAGCYRRMKAVQPERCLELEALNGMQPAAYVSRSGVTVPGWRRLDCVISRPAAMARLAMAEAGGIDIRQLPRHVLPRYMQPSQAERKAGLG